VKYVPACARRLLAVCWVLVNLGRKNAITMIGGNEASATDAITTATRWRHLRTADDDDNTMSFRRRFHTLITARRASPARHLARSVCNCRNWRRHLLLPRQQNTRQLGSARRAIDNNEFMSATQTQNDNGPRTDSVRNIAKCVTCVVVYTETCTWMSWRIYTDVCTFEVTSKTCCRVKSISIFSMK